MTAPIIVLTIPAAFLICSTRAIFEFASSTAVSIAS
jgi:hypothetical protein